MHMLREIEIFRTVMTVGTTSKAARLLDISQPAVSQSLRKLEEYAGLALFQRLRGRLHPTPEALVLMAEVDRCFVGMEAIDHRIKSLRQFGVGRINVASMPAMGAGFLPRVLGAVDLFQEKVTVSLQLMSSREVRERVVAGQCDVGLMADEVSTAGIEHSVFARFEGVIAMPKGHALARKSCITPSDLDKQPFIALNPEDTTRRRLQAVLVSHGITPSVVVETPFAFTICELVCQGVGIGLVNPLMALEYANRGVVLRPFSVPVPFTCLLGLPAGKPMAGVTQTFLAAMRKQLDHDLRAIQTVLAAPLK